MMTHHSGSGDDVLRMIEAKEYTVMGDVDTMMTGLIVVLSVTMTESQKLLRVHYLHPGDDRMFFIYLFLSLSLSLVLFLFICQISLDLYLSL